MATHSVKICSKIAIWFALFTDPLLFSVALGLATASGAVTLLPAKIVSGVTALNCVRWVGLSACTAKTLTGGTGSPSRLCPATHV